MTSLVGRCTSVLLIIQFIEFVVLIRCHFRLQRVGQVYGVLHKAVSCGITSSKEPNLAEIVVLRYFAFLCRNDCLDILLGVGLLRGTA